MCLLKFLFFIDKSVLHPCDIFSYITLPQESLSGCQILSDANDLQNSLNFLNFRMLD